VLLIVLSGNGMPEGDYAGERGKPDVVSTEASPEAPAEAPTITSVEPPPAAPLPTIEASLTPATVPAVR
jgi:chemotaxis protein MotB